MRVISKASYKVYTRKNVRLYIDRVFSSFSVYYMYIKSFTLICFINLFYEMNAKLRIQIRRKTCKLLDLYMY